MPEMDAHMNEHAEQQRLGRKIASLGNFRWGDTLTPAAREIILKELAAAGEEVPAEINDSDLYLKWLRA